MPSKSPSARPAESLSTAALKTRSAIQNLQARLAGASHLDLATEEDVRLAQLEKEGKDEGADRLESEEELELQLKAYFTRASSPRAGITTATTASSPPRSRTQLLDELRSRVIDGVVERVLNEWAGGQRGELADAVMERLIERVLQQFRLSSGASKSSLPS
jgi:hypothetical protein